MIGWFFFIQETLWYFCYLIFLGSQMIKTRMSHSFLSFTDANCVGGIHPRLWRHRDVIVFVIPYFDTNWKQSVANLQIFHTSGSIPRCPLGSWGHLRSNHLIWKVKRSFEVKYCLYWILPLTRPSPNRGIQMNFPFYIYVI